MLEHGTVDKDRKNERRKRVCEDELECTKILLPLALIWSSVITHRI